MPNNALQLTSAFRSARFARFDCIALAAERYPFGGLARDAGLAAGELSVILLV